MGVEYIKIWIKCAEEMRKPSCEQFGQDKKAWTSSVIICFVLATYIITLISVFAPHFLSPCIWSTILLIETIVSAVYFLRVYRKEPVEELNILKSKAEALCRSFMVEMGISSSKLPIVREAVSQYCQDRRAARKTVTDRAFAFCICGALIRCIPLLEEACSSLSQTSALLYLSVCIICVFAAPLAGVIWDIFDNFRSVPLQKAESMLACIDCFELYRRYDAN